MFFWRLMTPIFKRLPGKVMIAVAISLLAGLYSNDIFDNARIFGLLPFFVWLTWRVGKERKRLTTKRQGRMADMSSLVEESLSVSGILLGKTMGRGPALAERFGNRWRIDRGHLIR